MIRVTICREHGLQLLEAARECGSSDEQQQLNFVADMLESSLYPPVLAFAGEAAAEHCLLCCRLFPAAALEEAVIAALMHRQQHGVRRTLLQVFVPNASGGLADMSAPLDLTGRRFGHLRVLLREGGGMWLCQCDCSRVAHVSGDRLRSGQTRSCGCLPRA